MNAAKTESTRSTVSAQECQEQPSRQETVMIRESSQLIFFFQGDFRTWAQVEARARLQMALERNQA